ncbi:MAG: DUF6089 family protein [Bacteroidetes bacterium]|nr:DUF6089 family protein [Bacteroidota bacterium]MDA1267778.1 DUF6089 family protein [Bacteroidota bacterium]
MNKINFKILNSFVLGCFLVFSPLGVLIAQSYEIGGGLGTAVYSGDILRKIDAGQSGLQGTLFGRRNFDNVWSLKVGLNLAEIMAADSIRPIDALASLRQGHFTGRITELSAIMEFNFLDYVNHKSEFRFSPYAFFGMGYAFMNAEGRLHAGAPVENYRTRTLVIPFGGGLKYLLTDQFTLGMEMGFRPTTSDALDQFDGALPALPRYETPLGPDTKALPQSLNFGNPNTKDWYYFLGLTLSYTLTKARCYTY